MNASRERPVVIIGAGLAGLACGRELARRNVPFVILEAGDAVGGRLRTDRVDGFLLDRGFQTLQTAYPEAKRVLNYESLALNPFEPGALIRHNGQFVRMVDPWRRPLEMVPTMSNRIGTIGDRMKLGFLRHRLSSEPAEALLNGPDTSTEEYLRKDLGFSDDFINQFLRPWFGGVFFDKTLSRSRRFFDFIFCMFAIGDTSLPAAGMQAIPQQLADSLPKDALCLETPVESIDGLDVCLTTGERRPAAAVVIATDGVTAARLAGGAFAEPETSATTCVYYAADESPLAEPMLVVNGDGDGPINNLSIPSDVAASYAPDGQSLVGVTVIDPEWIANPSLEEIVRLQLKDWFGKPTNQWRHLATYRIPAALPAQRPGSVGLEPRHLLLVPGLYCCGDDCLTSCINGALQSGRFAATAVADDMDS